jgi:CheY-like chemotaxis protein
MDSPDTRPPTVLVADDEAEIVRLLARALGAAGFVVLTAGGGAEAVEVYRRKRERIDVVLLDVMMPPPLDGPDALRELQRLDPAVRAAFMSGSAGDYTADDLRALGALRVFAKPFASLPGLADALRDLLPA